MAVHCCPAAQMRPKGTDLYPPGGCPCPFDSIDPVKVPGSPRRTSKRGVLAGGTRVEVHI